MLKKPDRSGVGLWPLDCLDRGCEPLLGYRYSSPLFVVCCVGSGLCDRLTTRSEYFYRVH